MLFHVILLLQIPYIYISIYSGENIIWSPDDFVSFPTDKEIISL